MHDAAKAVDNTVDVIDDVHDLGKSADNIGDGVCFVAGTLVYTESGHRAIEDIVVGDRVWAWDEKSGDIAIKEVVETYINETSELVHIFVGGEEIVTTPSHPFYSPVKGWTDAVHLRAGDILVTVNGELVVVEKIQHEILESPITVYNFQVEGYHTYSVSRSNILVHNSCSKNFSGHGQAPKTGNANSTYTQLSSDGYNTVSSRTYYTDFGQPKMRVDYSHSHGNLKGPHVHIFSYYEINGKIFRNDESIYSIFEYLDLY